VVPFSAGGATDQVWRVLDPRLNQALRAHNIRLETEYLPGAGGAVGTGAAARRSEPTLVFSSAALVMVTLTGQSPGYDIGSFRMVGYAGYLPLVLFANPNQISSWTDLRALCRQRMVLYGNSGLGSMTQVSAAQVLRQLPCNSTPVPYRSASLALPDLINGSIDLVMDHAAGSALGLSQQGRIRALVVLSDRRLESLPDVPTATQVGVVSDLQNWHALVANPAVASSTMAALQTVFSAVTNHPSTQAELLQTGLAGFQRSVSHTFLQDQQQRLAAAMR